MSESALERLLRATDVYLGQLLSREAEDEFVVTQQPGLITGEMRAYQVEGLDWLAQLSRHGFNGILADEMGLGKTLQSISLLALARERGWTALPHLVVVPKTTIANWTNEFARFCPIFRTVALIGTAEERQQLIETRIRVGDFDVLITSFDVCRIEISALRKLRFGFFILDEAHRIKNEESILSCVVRAISAERILLLTGTPLQNNLHELWAILNFIMPKIFSSSTDFDEIFAALLSESADAVAATLHRILRPFMLRRLKTDVARDLPPKKELFVYVHLTPLQRQLYRDIVLKNADSVVLTASKTRLVNTLMQLRKCCNHPYLFPGLEPGPPFLEGEHLISESGKLVVLDKLVGRIFSNPNANNQILIFSQMTRLLDILDDYCRWRKYPRCRIDGATASSDRQQQIDEFSATGSAKKIFLLSTRAGGLGINLVSANFVIIFDADFNPQADLQAVDRAHRIGQTRPVTVYRFVTAGTVEEKIVESASRKMRIDKLVIQKSGGSAHLDSKDELSAMLRFGVSELFSQDAASSNEDVDALLEFSEKKTDELSALSANQFDLKLDNTHLPTSVVAAAEVAAAEFSRNPDLVNYVEIGPRERKPVLAPPKKSAAPVLKTRLAEWRAKVGGGHEYQFFDSHRLDALEKKKSLTKAEKNEQAKLLSEGFPNWPKRHFLTVTKMLEEGAEEAAICAALPERSPEEVSRYIDVLFKQGRKFLGDAFMSRFSNKVKRAEKFNQLVTNQLDALDRKFSAYDSNVWKSLPVTPPDRSWPLAADRVILCGVKTFGYGNWAAIKQLLRTCPSTNMDFAVQLRTREETQVRADALLKIVLAEFPKKSKKNAK